MLEHFYKKSLCNYETSGKLLHPIVSTDVPLSDFVLVYILFKERQNLFLLIKAEFNTTGGAK